MIAPNDTARNVADWHQALFYRGAREYAEGVGRFVRAALDARRPVFVAVPPAHAAVLRADLGALASRVRVADMTVLGRNPSRIIPGIREFVDEHRDQPVSFVGEPIWAGRSPAEVAEATRHEALINTAFAGCGADVLCPYDIDRLASTVVADAHRTHPELVDGAGRRAASMHYTDPCAVWANTGYLPHAPVDAARATVSRATIGGLRPWLRRIGEAAGLAEDRVQDLLLAVTELATNSMVHGGGTAHVAAWTADGVVQCDVTDAGTVRDPMVGRRRPSVASRHYRGLFLVNQLCDLVQLHSSDEGTTVRVTVSLSSLTTPRHG